MLKRYIMQITKITLFLSRNSRISRNICILYCTTFIIVLPWTHMGNPYSVYQYPFWDKQTVSHMVMDQNRKRLSAAKSHISDMDSRRSLREYGNSSDLDLVIGIITVRRLYGREDTGYLTQTLATFDDVFRQDSWFSGKALFMCNVHAGPGKHTEVEWLSTFFPTASRFPNGDTASVIMDIFEKEKQDYAFCLEQSLKYHSKYVLLVEDDALPFPELFQMLNYTLDNYIEQQWVRGNLVDRSNQWAYLKLFYPLKWQGFGLDITHILELMALAAIGGSLFVAMAHLYHYVYVLLRIYRRRHLKDLSAFVCGAVYSVLVALAVGRQSLLELRRTSPVLYNVVTAPDCCSPGILYQPAGIPDIIDNLKGITCRDDFGIDIALNKYVNDRRLDSFLVEPNLFKHIGYISTIKGPAMNPIPYLD